MIFNEHFKRKEKRHTKTLVPVNTVSPVPVSGQNSSLILQKGVENGKQKSPVRATSRSRSQPPTPGGREKVTQINVCIVTNKCTISTKASSLFPKQGDQNAKVTKETHRQRAGQDQTRSLVYICYFLTFLKRIILCLKWSKNCSNPQFH